MPTTFSTVSFRNKTLDLLTGVNTSPTPIYYVVPYNGTQPADPDTTPAGTKTFSTTSSGPILNTKLSAASGGISQLSSNAAPNTAANAVAATGLTFARLFNAAQQPIIDAPVSLTGGGGGVILDGMNCTAGVGNVVQGFSLKLPSSLGTLKLGAALQNRLVDLWAVNSMTAPQFGTSTGGACSITLHSGTVPATADEPAGPVLATFTMSATNIWAAAVGGAAALSGAGPSVTASGTGTPTYFRMTKTLTSNPTMVFQGTVSATSGAADMILNTTSLTSGVTSVQITDFTLSA